MSSTDPISEPNSRVPPPDIQAAWGADFDHFENDEFADSFSGMIDEGAVPWYIPNLGYESKLESKLRRLARITSWGVEFDEFTDDEFAEQKFIDDIGDAFDSEFDELIYGDTVDIELDNADQLLDVEPTEDTTRTVSLDEVARDLTQSGSARTKAALLSIGRPSSKQEIAERCGLPLASVGSHLSALPDVVRADKKRWGLAEWVEDEYEGIPAEIVQRIVEDGGSTRLNRLLEELPRLFGVSESSVRSYIHTPAFRLEHGWVSQVEVPDVILGELDDVADGRDIHGDPYWVFEVHDRYLRGFSITGVPPELAASLGCQWGNNESVAVRSPRQCPDLSVIWRRTSPTGPEIGRVATALKAIEVSDGQTACLIIHKEGDVSMVCNPEISSRSAQTKIASPLKSLGPRSNSSNRTYLGVRIGPALRATFKNTSTDRLGTIPDKSFHSPNRSELPRD